MITTYKDVSGNATFTQSETDKITKELSLRVQHLEK